MSLPDLYQSPERTAQGFVRIGSQR